MNLKNLNEKVKYEIIEVELKIKNLIKEIYHCNSFEKLNLINLLINKEIKKKRKLIEDYEKLYLDTKSLNTKFEIENNLENFKCQLDDNYKILKNANLVIKNKISQNFKEKLFYHKNQDEEENIVKKRVKQKEDIFLVNKTNSITKNLFQITKLMSEQVNQSNTALQTLINSSSIVTETQEEIKLMGSHLINSKTLLTKYGRRECTDKILIFLALGFFFACVLYVITKRFF